MENPKVTTPSDKGGYDTARATSGRADTQPETATDTPVGPAAPEQPKPSTKEQ